MQTSPARFVKQSLALLALVAVTASADPDPIAVSHSTPWLRLYQYSPRLRGYRSAVNADRFFFSVNGRTDPTAELLAAIDAFATRKKVGTQGQPAACVFPARKRILENLLQRKFPDEKCIDLDRWLKDIGADEVHLVYVGAYAGNPASILGHTFLRFANSAREKSGREGLDLLSYSVGFQAITANDNRLVYMVKGLSGGYDGSYEIEPHYMKVGLYNNAESRDLWEVKLKISPADVDLLTMYLWELTFNAHIPYYFIDANCSYRLITFLEAVRPDMDVHRKLSTVVLPAETVRAVLETGWAEPMPTFRSSIQRRLHLKMGLLSDEQRLEFDQAIRSAAVTSKVSDPTEIDALLDYWLYENYRLQTQLSGERKDIMEATYRRAASLQQPSRFQATDRDIQEMEHLKPPFLGHDPKWIEIAGGASRDGAVGTFSYRSGVQPFWSADPAYREVSAIEYLGGDWELREKELARWDMTLIRARALDGGRLSWAVDAYATNHCLICESMNAQAHFAGGGGWTLREGWFSASLLARLHAAVWDDGGAQGMLAPGGLLSLKAAPSVRWTLIADSSIQWRQNLTDEQFDVRATYAVAQNWSVFSEMQYEELRNRADDLTAKGGAAIFF